MVWVRAIHGWHAFAFLPADGIINVTSLGNQIMKLKQLTLALGICATCTTPAMALTVTTSTDGTAMAGSLLAGGSGISISSVTYTGATDQGGYFSGAASAIGIDSGIILTSGDATLAPGPNTSDGSSAGLGTPGDTDLSAITGGTTNDANVLEFDFTTDTGDLFFSYVFASEEYNEFVGSFNDPFAFLLDGTNIAIVPGTVATPVTVDNVSCGDPFAPPSGGTNCSLYNNNDLDDGGPFFDVEYDGFTDVFTASATGLASGTHHIKLAIADALDTSLDSAVFIKAGSFSDTNPDAGVPEPASFALIGLGLAGLGFARKKKQI